MSNCWSTNGNQSAYSLLHFGPKCLQTVSRHSANSLEVLVICWQLISNMSVSRELKCVSWEFSNRLPTAGNGIHCSLSPNSFKADLQIFLARVHCITSLFSKQVVPSPVTFLNEAALNIKTQVLIVRCYYCLFIDVVFSMPRNSG